jgi:glycosyltransferase involved in cell wall biosynthesis
MSGVTDRFRRVRRGEAGAVPAPATRVRDALFIVWGPPSHGPRSRVLGRELGIDVRFVHATTRRGLLVAPFKYAYQAYATIVLLVRRGPDVVLVQSPPSLAVLVVAIHGAFAGTGFIVDAHSDAMLSPLWTRPRWLQRLLARRALATVVTNDHFAATIRSWGARALVLQDVPTTFVASAPTELEDGFHVMVVSTFADDEPLTQIVDAARSLPEITFHVTGDTGRAPVEVLDTAPPNVRFTGFLADGDYYALMRASDAVMCLTTRDHTMQRGACEALSIGTPVITSDWPILREYFRSGTVHVTSSPRSIADGVREMRASVPEHRRGIRELQIEQRRQWSAARAALIELLGGSDQAPAATGRP